ncbi:MAG TPA: D-arabinono-1,4-lactone oxidase [Rhizomicrobium sp.]|jgi:FAD-linked oxidoreductase|nr:D-arabinono-1,4-lactone oxidase [Rhizomicrobium sp.]
MKIVGGKWSNWSGGVRCKPREISKPQDEVDLAATVRQAVGPVRVPGAGHSFTPVNETNGTLIDLSNFTGLRNVDAQNETATLAAATPLWQVGPLLYAEGLGLKNMGDIDRQTLGGVVGTGTHGTGRTLRNFSAEVTGFRLLLANGELIHCAAGENADVFDAGRTSLGTLGVMTEITMNVRPAYKLIENNFVLPIDELLRSFDSLVTDNRHFEFFWFPYADVAVCKTLNETEEPAPEPRSAEEMRERGERSTSDQRAFGWINEALPYTPYMLKPAHRLFSSLMPSKGKVRWSHEIFPSPRTTRFNEMEYALPYDRGLDALQEVVEIIRKKRINTGFPIEYRTVAADDVWMSPFYGRESATIAVHQYHRVDTGKLFGACETIFRENEGRPHWGKRHTRTAEELAALYPRFDEFRAMRRRLDPEGKFLNSYLRRMFE